MNIFYLSHDPVEAAEFHHFNHSNKMLLEAVQMLCTAHRVLDGVKEIDPDAKRKHYKYVIHDDPFRDQHLYKATHPNHQCNIWTRETLDNYFWHYELAAALRDKYYRERGKHHKSHRDGLLEILKTPPTNLTATGLTPPYLGMPDIYKYGDAVTCYRRLYINDKMFSHWFDKIPSWIPENALYRTLDERDQPEIREPLY